MDEQKCGGGMHLHCCLMPILMHLVWIWGVLSLIFAFMAGATETFWGLPALLWLANGLVAGVLSMGKCKKPGMCRMGACGTGACNHGGKCC